MANIKANQRKHAIERAQQRYGVNLTARQIRMMVKLIQTGNSRPIRQISNTRMLHEVETGALGGERVWALYDKTRKNICTFYPKPTAPTSRKDSHD